jgi:hypothetical protein
LSRLLASPCVAAPIDARRTIICSRCVQGDRTVGITEKPSAALLDGIERTFGFRPSAAHGHDTIGAIEAMLAGTAKVFVGLGGNFAAAVPDWPRVQPAMQQFDLTVQISTKLNRGHLYRSRAHLGDPERPGKLYCVRRTPRRPTR